MTADPRFWDNLAEEYAAKPVELPEAFEHKIATTMSHLKPSHTILDVGCGTGTLALRLAGEATAVHGLDFSPEMIRIATGKAAAQGLDNVTFHVGAFDDSIPFAPGSLDGLCAYSILHLVEDRPDALARIFSLLRPGGFFISSTVSLGDTWVPYRPIISVMRMLGKAPFVSILKRETLLAEVRAAGFIDLTLPDVGAKPTTTFMVAMKP
ncbi:MAG: arsenite methyltransferase [Myxococcota bacterium]|jgi:arsenite methyltransferase